MPLLIRLPKINEYEKRFEETKYMTFYQQNYKNMLKKYSKIWIKVANLIGKDFDAEPIFNNEYLNTKMQTDFNHDELPPEIT